MKYSKKHILLALLLPLQIVIIQILSQKTAWIETYYSNGLYPYISKALRLIFGWFPFSIGDIIGLYLLVIVLKNIYVLFTNKFKNFIPKLLGLFAFLSVLHFCFYLFWGLNYFRAPLAKNLKLTQGEYTTEELYETTKNIASEFNRVHCDITQNDTVKVIVPYSSKEIYDIAPYGYINLASTYPQLQYHFPSIKSSLVSTFQSYNGTSGYINPITIEAQINNQIPKTGFAATTCHEIAHQIGWAAENDANFIGFLAATFHDDLYFNYSGYRMAYTYCIRELRKRDKSLAKKVMQTINKGILKDYNNSYLHWKQYENPIEPYLKKGYNSYLKANKQSKGINSYSYVVDLLIAYNKNK